MAGRFLRKTIWEDTPGDVLDERCFCDTNQADIPYVHTLRVHWRRRTTDNFIVRRLSDNPAA